MYFIVYKTTNLINQKIYVGIHKTEILDDGYLGSGTLLKRAINKYGKTNFHREVLHYCNSIEETLKHERSIVTEEFIKDPMTYNLCCGGMRGPIEETRKLALEIKAKQKQKRVSRYNKNPKLCKNCQQPLPYEHKRDTFCSSSCSASYNNTNRESIWTEERKERLSKKILQRCGNTKACKNRQRREERETHQRELIQQRVDQLQQFLPVKRI